MISMDVMHKDNSNTMANNSLMFVSMVLTICFHKSFVNSP